MSAIFLHFTKTKLLKNHKKMLFTLPKKPFLFLRYSVSCKSPSSTPTYSIQSGSLKSE